jgi:hypothetical protein
MDPMLLGTMRTAIENAVCFHAMTDNTAATMGARWRQSVNGAFETVENV